MTSAVGIVKERRDVGLYKWAVIFWEIAPLISGANQSAARLSRLEPSTLCSNVGIGVLLRTATNKIAEVIIL